jgi:hypothetical protein
VRFLDGQTVQASPATLADPLLAWCQRPARMTNAGAFTMAFGIFAVIWINIIFLAIYFGAMHMANPRVACIYGLANMFLLYIPWIFTGWQTIRRQEWAMWFNLAGGLLFLVLAVLSLTNIWRMDIGGMHENSPQTRWTNETIFGFLFGCVVFLNVLAIVACRAHRRRGGGPASAAG